MQAILLKLSSATWLRQPIQGWCWLSKRGGMYQNKKIVTMKMTPDACQLLRITNMVRSGIFHPQDQVEPWVGLAYVKSNTNAVCRSKQDGASHAEVSMSFFTMASQVCFLNLHRKVSCVHLDQPHCTPSPAELHSRALSSRQRREARQ